MTSVDGSVSVFAAGDVYPSLPDGRASLRALTPLLATADIVFGNCEGIYTDRPAKAPTRKHFMGAPRERGSMLGEAPFHVMTCANNHMLDGGDIGLADTVELLREQGIAVTGAGATVAEALRPAVVERNGVRVAFLGVCSVFPVGYEARADRPGIAALRVQTFYANPDPTFWEPGVAPVVHTAPMREDLARVHDALAAARQQADVVVVACHWGFSSTMEQLQDYERELAVDLVEHGADAVVCHHHHSLRGVTFHRGKPIFHGLGALLHHFDGVVAPEAVVAERRARYGALSSLAADPDFPYWPFHADTRNTGVAVLDVTADGRVEAGFLPCRLRGDGVTVPLAADDPVGDEVVDYLERVARANGFATGFERGERQGWRYVRLRPAPAST